MPRKTKDNKHPKKVRFFYFEKQKANNTCRVHAINNALGRSILSKTRFLEYCDQFDMQNKCKGSREFFFIDSNDNIISFILNQFHIQSSYYPPDNPPNLNKDLREDIMAVIIFDDGHIWCAKQHDNIWYELDSLSNGPSAIEFRDIFRRGGFGWIIVWNNNNNNNSLPNEQPVDSHIENPRKKSSSKRSSQHKHVEEDTVYDESF